MRIFKITLKLSKKKGKFISLSKSKDQCKRETTKLRLWDKNRALTKKSESQDSLLQIEPEIHCAFSMRRSQCHLQVVEVDAIEIGFRARV